MSIEKLAQQIVGKKILRTEVGNNGAILIIVFTSGQKLGLWANGPEDCGTAPWLEYVFKEVDLDDNNSLTREIQDGRAGG